MTTRTSDRPPNDNEQGGNVGKINSCRHFFLAIKLKTLIEMSVWCLCAFISAVTAVLSSFRHHHGLYAIRTADFELITH